MALRVIRSDFEPTPLHRCERVSDHLGVELWMKRDDLFPAVGGGSKARKVQYIFPTAKEKGHDAVVTTGGGGSNHVRSCAIMCARLGWKCVILVHDEEPAIPSSNLLLARLAGADIRFIRKEEVAARMDRAMEELQRVGFNPLYIWGGGHCIEGAYAYYDAVSELRRQWPKDLAPPDHVLVASGTGTTQAGIHLGFANWSAAPKVVGLSVARERSRGTEAVVRAVQELEQALDGVRSVRRVEFDDSTSFGGYERTDPALFATIARVASLEGIMLDPVYTAKAFYGIEDRVRNGVIRPGERVLFWNTGGLLNLLPFAGASFRP